MGSVKKGECMNHETEVRPVQSFDTELLIKTLRGFREKGDEASALLIGYNFVDADAIFRAFPQYGAVAK